MLKKQKSYYEKNVEEGWVHLDAQDKILGRFASTVAFILLGKHKVTYTPGAKTGHSVIITNADKIKVTGRKMEQKNYYRHSRYPGHLKTTQLKDMMQDNPENILREAVKTMLPRNKQMKDLMGRLRIYAGATHPHQAQQPQPIALERRKA